MRVFPRNAPRVAPSTRAWLLFALMLGPLALAGCTGDKDEPAPSQTFQVLVEGPEAPVTIGGPLEFVLRVTGGSGGVDRAGLAWANASTTGIDQRLLVEAAFDGLIWASGPVRLPAEMPYRIDRVPDEAFLYVRGVVEKDGRTSWGNETRIETRPAQPPLQIELKIKDLPPQTYWANQHRLRINATGANAETTRAGFTWNHASTPLKEPDTLKPEKADGYHATNTSLLLPGETALAAWSVPSEHDLYLRPWMLINGTYHWGEETRLRSTSPPVYDHKDDEVDHEITISPFLVPLEQLAAFEPGELQIQVGESVRWVNQADTVHSASRDENGTSFHSGNLGPGATSDMFRFLVPGEYSYRCRLHPETMEGVIVVTQ